MRTPSPPPSVLLRAVFWAFQNRGKAAKSRGRDPGSGSPHPLLPEIRAGRTQLVTNRDLLWPNRNEIVRHDLGMGRDHGRDLGNSHPPLPEIRRRSHRR
ncbi:hypothetical protein L484_024097 [Morus notabilis]|uniref:Uncharacterized protein n=1 Tax=Morus notabilis TaxID=981085 RepID=W9RQ24_9ROSA|nr:hypothetical protein L484_024097 [Morus notabilis]